MNSEQFCEIGQKLFGSNRGWKSSLANAINVSPATISQISNGKDPSIKVQEKLIRLSGEDVNVNSISTEEENKESNNDAFERIQKRYSVMEKMVTNVALGNFPSLIISGGSGTGKSFLTQKVLKEQDVKFEIVKGVASGVGMLVPLYTVSDGGIIVFDDCDSVFSDEDALNVLKAALDSTSERQISWLKASSYLKEQEIPNKFDFNGSVIFITNKDLQQKSDGNNRFSAHYSALINRSMYLDLTMRTLRDKCLRIRQIVSEGGFDHYDLGSEQKEEIVTFIEENSNRWRELSLRLVHHLAKMVKVDDSWKEMAEVSFMRSM